MPSIRRGVSELPYYCHAAGIDNIIISPGSRNAPLIIAFTSHPRLNCISITDERSAAYYGLGMAQQLLKPVVLICTSGTAMINYAPALAEAYYLKIPLIAITADRPAEWIDQNDGQTIRQKSLYQNVIKASFETPVETEKEEDLWYFRRKISEALTLAVSDRPGPVHINIPLREPLYEALPEISQMPPVITSMKTTPTLSQEQWAFLREKWKSFGRRLVLCGMESNDPELPPVLNELLLGNFAVVMAENLANAQMPDAIHAPDRFIASLTPQQKADFQPDLLVTSGGAVVSKKLKKYLRIFKPKEHWHIGENEPFIDTFQALNMHIGIKAADFFREIGSTGPNNNAWVQMVQKINQKSIEIHQELVDKAPFSDLSVYNTIFEALPDNCNLHLANSTPVRYSQLFENRSGVTYYSNRGTSGIDGCVSTAAGAAMVSEKINIAIVGDLAFVYDSNGLWNSKLPANLRVIVIDNEGGNIFKLIDTSPIINPIRHFFETPHNVSIDKLCDAFHVNYYRSGSKEELLTHLADFFKPNSRAGVLHIQTSGELSAAVFKQYYQFISNNNEQNKNLDTP